MVTMAVLAGCDPLVNIEGAFFPAWLVSGLVGVVATSLTWAGLDHFGINKHLLARPLTYFGFMVAYTGGTWLVLYG